MVAPLCIRITYDALPLMISLPGIGTLESLKGIFDFPRRSDKVLDFLKSINPLLAPITNIVKTINMITAIVNCVTAVPKAISRLSPSPVFNCISGLMEALAELAKYIPPFPYVRVATELLSLFRMLIDDLITLLQAIDLEITNIKAAIDKAMRENDPVLLEISNCAKEDLNQQAQGLFQLLASMTTIIAAIFDLLDAIAGLLPGPIGEKLTEARDRMATFKEQARSAAGTATDFPPLSELYTFLITIRDPIVYLETLGKTFLGLPVSIARLMEYNFQNP